MSRIVIQGLAITAVLVILALVAAPAAAAPNQGPMSTSIHVVRPGETLYSVARWYGVNVYDIAMANHLVNPNVIFAGQRLVIPGGYDNQPPYQAPPAYHPEPYHMPVPSARVYVVRPGETLYSIAMRFGTSVHRLAAANNITNANLIFASQRLVIPDGYPDHGLPGDGHPPTKAVKKVVVVEKKYKPKPLKPALCNAATRITFPRKGETLNSPGTHSILGTASIDNFQFYKLELGVGLAPIEFNSVVPVQNMPVVNGILYRDWNTGALPEGTYILRLTVVDETGNFPPPCDVVVHIDHPDEVDP
jgi:LysM repeat protein